MLLFFIQFYSWSRLVGDTKVILQALLPKLKQNPDNKHLELSVEHYRKARKALAELAVEGSERKGSHPQIGYDKASKIPFHTETRSALA
jgi:hypothetical protein